MARSNLRKGNICKPHIYLRLSGSNWKVVTGRPYSKLEDIKAARIFVRKLNEEVKS